MRLQDALFHESCKFFGKALGYRYAFLPVTTDAISSPMGLGSDSKPVPVQLGGQSTHLADSMQFALEYLLRVGHGTRGVYYAGCSFRGEEHDNMHLNQFFHIECEMVGDFEVGINIAEKYIVGIVDALLKQHSDLIKSTAGSLDHIVRVVELFRTNKSTFPRVTLETALAQPDMTEDCWTYVVPGDVSKGKVLTRTGERRLIARFGGAVWLTHLTHLSVPFYQGYTDGSHQYAKCADLLLGPGEILGLGERHSNSDDVVSALAEHHVAVDPYQWYCNMRDMKPMRTTGWGIGTERLLAWLLNHDDIRDLAIIPRLKGMVFAP